MDFSGTTDPTPQAIHGATAARGPTRREIMLSAWECDAWVRRNFKSTTLGSYETDDILDRLHGLACELLRARGAVREDRIDSDRVAHQPLHFPADRAELRDGKINQRRFEC